MKGPDVDQLHNCRTQVEVAARIAAVLAAVEVQAPYVSISDYNMGPAEIAVHTVNHACKDGRLGFLAKAVGVGL